MGQFEIEIKLPVKNRQEVSDILKDLGFTFQKELQEEDIYFNSEFRDIKERDEALRIRRSLDCTSGEKKAQINFKGPKIDSVSMSRMELETEVEDGEILKNILCSLGFYPVAVNKTRKYLALGNITACLDQVVGLGDFLELEILTEDEEQREQCLEQISDIMETLGCSMKDTVRTSYLGMLMERKQNNGVDARQTVMVE